QQFSLDVEQRHAPALGQEPFCSRKPDAARRTGDQRDILRRGCHITSSSKRLTEFRDVSSIAELVIKMTESPSWSSRRLVLDGADDRGQNGAGHAAAGHLADNAADIRGRGA